jgi:S1-C subfamily serine protease
MSESRLIGRVASVEGVPCDVYEDPDGRQWILAYGSRLYGLWLPKDGKQAPHAAADERITVPSDTGIPSIPQAPVPLAPSEPPTAAEPPRRPWVWLAALVAFGAAFGVALILMAPGGALLRVLEPRPSLTTPDHAAGQVEGADSSKPSPTKAAYTSEELYRLASPGVVTITLKNDGGKSIGLGSGIFVTDELVHDPDAWVHRELVEWRSKDGRPQQFAYLLTNYHVIEPAVDAEISLSDGSKGYVYEVITEDEVADLALLTVFVNSANPVTRLQLAERAPSVGASVYAIGSPRGLANSLSTGIISGIREVKQGASWLQTTAPISPGSSGGPLLSPNGEVVGVTTAIRRDGQNLNFAIPVSELRSFLSAQYITRPLWKGRSYLQEVEYTFDTKLGLAWINRHGKPREDRTDNDPEELLLKARREMRDDKVDDAIQTLSSAKPSIPPEYNYLYHFLLVLQRYG